MGMSMVILIPGNGMGHADPALQQTLIQKYLSLLEGGDVLPESICFYTEGVRLVTEGSPVIALLEALEARGVQLIVCSTCLEHFGIANQIRAGRVAGMTDILDAQMRADKVVTI
jgi:sulfur relay (sulfurtransferase) complex TusBCD TusD component (DsrE family)